MARPVVGGHFAFLALERACGGKATEGLKFLDEEEPAMIDTAASLQKEKGHEDAWRIADLRDEMNDL